MIIKAGYIKSKKASVSDYFRDLGIAESQQMSQKNFGNFLKHTYSTTDITVKRLCKHFIRAGKGSLIDMKTVVEEINKFEYVRTMEINDTINYEEIIINAIKQIEEFTQKTIEQIINLVEFNKSGYIDTQSLISLFKTESKNVDMITIEAAIRPLISNNKQIALNDIQKYLISFSSSKQPSIELEILRIRHNAKVRELDVKEYLKSIGIKLQESIKKVDFVKILTKKLAMNTTTAQLITGKLSNRQDIYINDFLKFITGEEINNEPLGENLSSNAIIEELEKTGKPLFEILEYLIFNEESNITTADLITAMVKLYPKVDQQYASILKKHIDPNENEIINLNDLILFIEKNSKSSKYPKLTKLTKLIITNSSVVNMNDPINVKDFTEKLLSPTKIQRKNLYFLYATFVPKKSNIKLYKDLFAKLDEYISEPNEELKVNENSNSMKPITNRVLINICKYLYSNNGKKSEEILFRQMDTNNDGFIKRIELERWFKKAKIAIITDKELDEFFHIVDENNDGMLSFYEFLNAIKTVRGDDIISSVKIPITSMIRIDSDSILKSGLAKLAKFIEKESPQVVNEKFLIHDKFVDGILKIEEFNQILSNMKLRLRQEEIK